MLFTDNLYQDIGWSAIESAGRIRDALVRKGYELAIPSPTNQIFILLTKKQAEGLSEKVEMSFMEQTDDGCVMMRIVTSWATGPEETDRLIACL